MNKIKQIYNVLYDNACLTVLLHSTPQAEKNSSYIFMRTLFSVLFLSFLFETGNVTNNYNSSTISDHTHGINPRSSHAPASPPSATAQPLIILDLLHLIFFRRQLFFEALIPAGLQQFPSFYKNQCHSHNESKQRRSLQCKPLRSRPWCSS